MGRYRKEGMWNEVVEPDDVQARQIEAIIERRRKCKRLADCTLPAGFRLVYPEPKQIPMAGQLRWAFVLAWAPRGRDEYFSPHRYEAAIADEQQMQWAIEEFSRELTAAGVDLGDVVIAKRTTRGPKGNLRRQVNVQRRSKEIAALNRMYAL